MATNTDPIFIKTPVIAAVQLVNATGTTVTTLYTAPTEGALVMGIEAVTDDTAANDVNLYIQVGGSGTNYPIGGKRVAAGSGNPAAANPTAAVNVLDVSQMPFLLPDGTLLLGNGDVLKVNVQAAVTAAKTLTLTALIGKYV